jgi:hypothetical protein
MYYALKHHVAPQATFLPQRQVGGKRFFFIFVFDFEGIYLQVCSKVAYTID